MTKSRKRCDVICSATRKLDDQILALFGQKAALTADEIHHLLRSQSRLYSLAAVYKALRALRAAGVLVKQDRHYSLSQSWLLELADFAQQSLACKNDLFPELEEGGEIRWSYGSLFHLNDAFSAQILALIKSAKKKVMYSWNPHPWFHLVQADQEKQYLSALRKLQVSMLKRVGGETQLDREIAAEWIDYNIDVSYSDNSWKLKETEYHVVLAPFIVTARIPKRTAETIDAFFKNTASISEVNLKELRRVFQAASGT
ncbi:MAG: hypothetical protein KDD62_10575, partial [Bdellovibrionales bacterium]|nr:hypothetical protein [Bdellovibrionales bacterium]